VCAAAPWLLSYDDAPEVRELLDGWGISSVQAEIAYSAHPSGGHSFRGRELLYSNLPGLRKLAKQWKGPRGLAISTKRAGGPMREPRVTATRNRPQQLDLFSGQRTQLTLFEEATV